jgi:hypothetical protein
MNAPRSLLPTGFSTKTLHEFLFTLTCAACPAHHIGLGLVSAVLFGREYRLWSLWTHGHGKFKKCKFLLHVHQKSVFFKIKC